MNKLSVQNNNKKELLVYTQHNLLGINYRASSPIVARSLLFPRAKIKCPRVEIQS